jgi:hypothetical protein
MNEFERDSAMFAIDREIGIERQHGMPRVDLGHSHDTGVSERHRFVRIFLMQLQQSRDMLLNAERDAKRSILEKSEQCVLSPRKPR